MFNYKGGTVLVKIFELMEKEGHEQVHFLQEKSSGLKAIIAIHDTTLGPALGGCRMWPYATEDEAVMDALRLSKGMTYKSGAAGVDFGGGKTVIWGDPAKDKSEALFRALGRFVDSMGGRYSTGTDVGTTYDDFVMASKETKHVGALPEAYGGSGDSSVITAFGVWKGIKACAKFVYGNDSLNGLTVAVQGVGKVGSKVVGYLMEEGAKCIVSDVNEKYVQMIKEKYPTVTVVSPEEILFVECDILSPNALGAIINDNTIDKIKCKIIGGAANNQLAEKRHGEILHQKGILYAPDYVINAGGLIQVADEAHPTGYKKDRAFKHAETIYDLILKISQISKERNIPTYLAADHMVDERIAAVAKVKRIKK